MALVIVLLVLALTLAFFHLKCTMMQSFVMLWSSVVATILALSYYEVVAGLFISRGYVLQWAHFGCYLIIFIACFALLRSGCEFLTGVDIDLGNMVKTSTAIVCGFLTGIIFSGNLLIVMGHLPMQGKIFYSRFDASGSVSPNNPKAPVLGTDAFVSSLYGLISSGSMSSDKSFNVLHADYLSQIHLNKLKVKDRVLTICSPEAMQMPSKKGQHPVRLWVSPDNKEFVVVRMGIKDSGGAGNNFGKITFFPAQIRLVVKDKDKMTVPTDNPLTGSAKALYPVGFLENNKVIEKELNEIISPKPEELKNRVLWLDIAFNMPPNYKPVLLEFKQNGVMDLSSYDVVKSSPEVERALDGDGQEDE